MAERLLDDDRAFFVISASDPAEQEWRDLEVEDGNVLVLDRIGDAAVGRGVGEVALDVGKPRHEALEDTLVELLAGGDDRVAGALDELVDRPVVNRNADDRTVEQAAPLEPVERVERHHSREVARDPEDHEHVRVLRSCCSAHSVRLSLVIVRLFVGVDRDPTGPIV